MQLISTFFKEVFLFKPVVYKDRRGSFSEQYNRLDFNKAVGSKIDFCQNNIVHSKKGVLRGLHYQLYPNAQSKLVSVIQGSVLDVVVDVRKGSPTFGMHFTQEINDINNFQLFIPRGFAHGYITLSQSSIFHYRVDNFYHLKSEGSIAPNDPELGIDWIIPETEWIQSDKDQKHPKLKDASLFNFDQNLYM